MKILLLGVGMQGKAALHDLVASESVEQVIAADKEFDMLRAHVDGLAYGSKVVCKPLDANDSNGLAKQFALSLIHISEPTRLQV